MMTGMKGSVNGMRSVRDVLNSEASQPTLKHFPRGVVSSEVT